MKKILILLLISACTAVRGSDVVIGSLSDTITWQGSGTDWYAVFGGGAAPVTTNDLVLWYQFLNGNNPTEDGSGLANNGAWGGLDYVNPTNGISGYMTFTAGDAITSTVSQAQGYISFLAATNNVWKFYEYLNGSTFVDRVAVSYPTNEYFTQAGDVITWGTGAYNADEYKVYTNRVPTYDHDRLINEVESKVAKGVTPQYLADNLDVYSNCVFAWSGNVLQDGSKNHLTMSSLSAPTPVNVKPNSVDLPNGNGAYYFNGIANNEDCGYSSVIATSLFFTVGSWVKPYETGRGDIVNIWENAFSEKFDLLQGVSSGKFAFYVSKQPNSFDSVTDPGSFVTNQWYFVVGTAASNVISLYTNGVLCQSKAMSAAVDDNSDGKNIKIGQSEWSTYFEGLIDEVFLIDKCLTSNEVFNLYNAQTNLFF